MTVAYAPTQGDVDINNPGHVANPDPFLRRLRHEQPVFRSDALRASVITRYPDVKWALSSPDLFSSSDALTATILPRQRGRCSVEHADLAHSPGNIDTPAHTSVRRTIARSFSDRA